MSVGLQAKKQYIEDQLAGLSPVQLLIRVYDVAIVSCAREDRKRLRQALVELIGSLNFEHREMSIGVFNLFNYCLRQAQMGRFDSAKTILVGLRDAWVQAERRMREDAAVQTVTTTGAPYVDESSQRRRQAYG